MFTTSTTLEIFETMVIDKYLYIIDVTSQHNWHNITNDFSIKLHTKHAIILRVKQSDACDFNHILGNIFKNY